MSRERKKIILVVTKGDMGGAQKYVQEVASGLNKDKYEVLVAGGKEGENLKIDISLKWLIQAYQPGRFFYNDFRAVGELRKVFKKEKPDIVHFNSSKAGVVGSFAARLSGVPRIIFTAHGWVFGDPTLSLGRRLFYVWLHRIAGLVTNKIICVSEADFELAVKWKVAGKKKLIRIWNGIDIEALREEALPKETAREELAARAYQNFEVKSEREFWVGSVGRLVKEKNYGLLIETVSGLIKKGIKLKVFLVGEGEKKREFKNKIISEGLEKDVFIVDPKGNDMRLAKAWDLFVLPSVKEGLPYTVIEAMALSVPIAVARTGGMTELAFGGRGFIFASSSQGELTKIIEAVMEDGGRLAWEQAEKARNFAEKNLDYGNFIRKTEEAYE